MSDFNALFNPTGVEDKPKGNTEVYKVSFKDGKNGIYRSIIRFIPNPADPSKNIMSKSVSWVKNPITQKGMYVDDPRSVNEFSPVTDMFFKLKNTGIATYEEFGKTYLGAKQQYASLVQIMSDEQHPELVGQIKVFVYGKKVWEKLHNEEYPQGAGQQGIIPFHPIYGRKFSLVCTNQSNFNNFDQSSFFDERNGNQIMPSGMWYIDPANPNQFSVVDENTDGQVLMNYLKENAPDLSKFDYHPWTEEQSKHVQEVLAIATNYLNTGSMQPSGQTQFQQSAQVVNTPQFPGSVPATPAPATPSFNPNPTFPGVTPSTAPAAPAAPAPTAGGFVPVTPSAPATPATPTPTTPAAPVAGVVPPTVTPKVADTPAAPVGQGMNMDDVLAQL